MNPNYLANTVQTQWQHLRPYVAGVIGLFVVSIVLGAGLVAIGFDIFSALTGEGIEDAVPDELTLQAILVNNTIAFLAMIALGAITLGVFALLAILINGIVIGFVAGPAVAEQGLGETLVLLVPHGILELPAIFIAAAVGLRAGHIIVNRIRGVREQLITRSELHGLAAVIAIAWIALAIAAAIEVYVTPALYEFLYGPLNDEI